MCHTLTFLQSYVNILFQRHDFFVYLLVILLTLLYKTKIKVKLSLCLTNFALRHEGVWGSGCGDPYFLDLGTSWRWVVSFKLRPLCSRRKSPRYPLDRRLGGPQSRSGRRGEEKILTLPGLELRTLSRPARSQSLYWLRYPGFVYRTEDIIISFCNLITIQSDSKILSGFPWAINGKPDNNLESPCTFLISLPHDKYFGYRMSLVTVSSNL
jgi:hypothetical protein